MISGYEIRFCWVYRVRHVPYSFQKISCPNHASVFGFSGKYWPLGDPLLRWCRETQSFDIASCLASRKLLLSLLFIHLRRGVPGIVCAFLEEEVKGVMACAERIQRLKRCQGETRQLEFGESSRIPLSWQVLLWPSLSPELTVAYTQSVLAWIKVNGRGWLLCWPKAIGLYWRKLQKYRGSNFYFPCGIKIRVILWPLQLG